MNHLAKYLIIKFKILFIYPLLLFPIRKKNQNNVFISFIYTLLNFLGLIFLQLGVAQWEWSFLLWTLLKHKFGTLHLSFLCSSSQFLKFLSLLSQSHNICVSQKVTTTGPYNFYPMVSAMHPIFTTRRLEAIQKPTKYWSTNSASVEKQTSPSNHPHSLPPPPPHTLKNARKANPISCNKTTSHYARMKLNNSPTNDWKYQKQCMYSIHNRNTDPCNNAACLMWEYVQISPA